MKYILAGHYYIGGSGYTYILEKLAYGLIEAGHEVMILGIGYNGSEHRHPFKIVPIKLEWLMEALRVLPEEWKSDRTVVAADINILHDVFKKFTAMDEKQALWKMEALFPVESSPIKRDWRLALSQFKNRFVISNFGKEECEKVGLTAIHLPVGCDVIHINDNKTIIRELLDWDIHKTIFLTVADNQERKSLPLALEAFAKEKENAHYYIVTSARRKIGWVLEEIIEELDLRENVTIINNSLEKHALSMIYHACDALIIPSQAEGACLPIYEAASHGLPVICGTWTGMQDVEEEPWTLNIGYDYKYRYPWGNVNRWMASISDMSKRIKEIKGMSKEYYRILSEQALDYASKHTWENTVKVLIENG